MCTYSGNGLILLSGSFWINSTFLKFNHMVVINEVTFLLLSLDLEPSLEQAWSCSQKRWPSYWPSLLSRALFDRLLSVKIESRTSPLGVSHYYADSIYSRVHIYIFNMVYSAYAIINRSWLQTDIYY